MNLNTHPKNSLIISIYKTIYWEFYNKKVRDTNFKGDLFQTKNKQNKLKKKIEKGLNFVDFIFEKAK